MVLRIGMFVACIVMISVVGCRSGESDGPKTVPASGIVTLDGVAVEGAQVVFVDDANKYSAFSATDSSGKFSMKLSDKKKGAVPGSYKVSVSKTIMEQTSGEEGTVNLKYGLPKKYNVATESGLTVTVPETGTEDIKLELKSN